jgi:hypothetical protein
MAHTGFLVFGKLCVRHKATHVAIPAKAGTTNYAMMNFSKWLTPGRSSALSENGRQAVEASVQQTDGA